MYYSGLSLIREEAETLIRAQTRLAKEQVVKAFTFLAMRVNLLTEHILGNLGSPVHPYLNHSKAQGSA